MELLSRAYDYRLAHNWMIATSQTTGGKTIHHAALLELRDGDGVIGYGEASPSTRYGEDAQTCLEFLQRLDAERLSFDDVEGSMRYVESLSGGDFSPKGAVNVALLDGAAKKARKSLHDYLKLSFTEGAHLSSITIGIDAPEVIREKTREAAEFPILKMKVGAPNDRANHAAIRDVAPEKTMRVDANEAWSTKEEALRHIEELARDPHIEFIEQPMPATNSREDFIWLKERSPLPIIADESYINADAASICADCFHGVNVKLAKTGGMTRGVPDLPAPRVLGLKETDRK